MIRTQFNYPRQNRVKLCVRHITPVKKSLLKLLQQLTSLHFTRAKNLLLGYAQNLLKCMNNNLPFVIHKNLHECLLAIKITTLLTKASIITPRAVGGQLRSILSSQSVFICHLSY